MIYHSAANHGPVRVGLVINPIAGMGGAVGLKGTDSPATLDEARRRGASPISQERTAEALRAAGDLEGYEFLTAGGAMGEDVLRTFGADPLVVCRPGPETYDADTREACRALLEAGIDILVFTGGDGTARDVMDAVGESVPVIGIPSGVKMQSGVFANTPRDAGALLRRWRIEDLPSRRTEVMDIDEEQFRGGRISSSLYGYMLAPEEPALMQPFKVAWGGGTEDEMKDALAEYFVGEMQASVLYILGPGTTMEAVGRKLGIDKTLLGVDAVYDWKQVAKDADEAALLALLDSYPDARIVVTPIGQQGFIFGRGNQQISPEVIWKAGVKNVVVLATPLKMRETRTLRVDTGDILLDDELRGYQRVIVEYGKQLVATVR